MKIIQYLFKFYYTIFQNFSSLIKSKDDEIDYLNNKITSLNKSNDSLKKKNSKLKLEIKRLNGKVIQKHNVTSVSPKYQPFAVDKPPIKKISPKLDFNELIAGRTFKVSKIVRTVFSPRNTPNIIETRFLISTGIITLKLRISCLLLMTLMSRVILTLDSESLISIFLLKSLLSLLITSYLTVPVLKP